MLKKLVLLLAALVVLMSAAFAAIDVNTADQASLETLKGVGPVISKAIIDERNTHGPFKDADDLARRVKGIGPKSVSKLQAQGLTFGGSSTSMKANSPTPAKSVKPSPAATPASSAPSAAMPASAGKETKSSAKSKKNKKSDKANGASAASGA